MTRRPCTSDLAVRERRGALTPADRMAFEAHLSGCASCRIVREIGDSFDGPDAPELDDGARIQRLARVAEEWTKRGRTPRRWRPARAMRRRLLTLLAACIVLCCGMAAAALGKRVWLRPAPVSPASVAPAVVQAPVPPPARHGVDRPAAPQADPLEDTDENETESAGLEAAGGAPSRVHGRRAVPAAENAHGLFREANDARRRADARAAVAIYRKLQRQFPASPEADLSAIPLGELLLEGRSPEAALRQFDRSASVRAGTFRPEALYGRARAMAALGDEAGERRAWQEILDEYPACPYAEAARRRLAAKSWSAASPSP